MRPRSLDELVGQKHVIAPGKLLYEAISQDRVPSIILCGPARHRQDRRWRASRGARDATRSSCPSARCLAGVPELRAAIQQARRTEAACTGKRTTLFVDEIHRFNKAQQDALLPHVEEARSR